MARAVFRGLLGACGVALAKSTGEVFVADYLPNDIAKGQQATKVDLSAFGWNGTNDMHSGFLTLDKKLGRNTFFWYSEALDGNKDAPLLLWLQGGPGASSLFGLFTEIGPFGIGAESGSVEARAVTWNQHFHLIFLDNPVGTGFSFTNSDAGFVKDQVQVGQDLYDALSQFYQLFPQLRANDFYVTGESYAGKYVPACAYTIHEQNKKVAAADRINMKGISIGDGAFDPKNQFVGFGELLYNAGMVDHIEKQGFDDYEQRIQQLLTAGENVKAFRVFDEMLNADYYPYGSYYANVTGMTTNYFNYELAPDATPIGGAFVDWLNKPAVRAQIHVGDRSYAPDNQTVETHLMENWLQGVTDMLVPVMENYKVIIYSGQNDVILGPALTENALRKLEWSGQNTYLGASKVIWRLSTKGPGSQLPDVAGYAREVGDFRQVVVRGAGHMVPGDQPVRSLDLIERFVAGKSFADGGFKPMSHKRQPVGDIVV